MAPLIAEDLAALGNLEMELHRKRSAIAELTYNSMGEVVHNHRDYQLLVVSQ